jgi:hypothetical protein
VLLYAGQTLCLKNEDDDWGAVSSSKNLPQMLHDSRWAIMACRSRISRVLLFCFARRIGREKLQCNKRRGNKIGEKHQAKPDIPLQSSWTV